MNFGTERGKQRRHSLAMASTKTQTFKRGLR